MSKKIFLIALFAGISGLLVWGGINRTLARTSEGGLVSAESTGRGTGKQVAESHTALNPEDFEGTDERGQSADGLGRRGKTEDDSKGNTSETKENWGQGNELKSSQGSNNAGHSNGKGNGSDQGGGYNPLAEAEIKALHMALDDEYHALAVYQAVIADFGEVPPFVEIAQSESRHIEALLKHFDKNNLNPPENTWLGNVPSFENLQEACQAGVEAELANIALYEQLFSMADDPGLIQVFTNLSRASQESHLPEFQSCQ